MLLLASMDYGGPQHHTNHDAPCADFASTVLGPDGAAADHQRSVAVQCGGVIVALPRSG